MYQMTSAKFCISVIFDRHFAIVLQVKRQKEHLDIIVEPFDTLTADVQFGLEAEVTDIARFLGIQAVLHILPSS